ncbi:MAG: hypothetical protein IT244_11940 [Bacteroidia bacterium]|nr:hypothetical protein [Bacteroidia bacterium]
MKKHIFICATLGFLSSASAQDMGRVFRKYKYRFQEFRSSDFQLSGDFGSNNYENRDTLGNYNFENSRSGLSAGFQFTRLRYSNTDSKIKSSTASVYSDYGKSRGRNSSFGNSTFNIYANYNANTQYYRPNSLNYIGISYGASGSTFRDMGFYTFGNEISRTEIANAGFSVNGTLVLGRGRIENVSDPSFMAFWLKDLRDKGLISRYSENNIIELAKALTTTRNTRIMDFRFRMIDQIKMLDTAFQNSALLKDKGAAYFTTLYDHYLYSSNFSRFNGSNFEFGFKVQPQYNNGYNFFRKNDSSLHISRYNRSAIISPSIVVKYIRHMAKTLHSQFGYGAEFNSGYELSENRYKYFNLVTPSNESSASLFAAAIANVNYTLIVDTRNYITQKINAGMLSQWFQHSTERYSYAVYSFDYYHLFSPHLQFTAHAHFNMYKNVFNYSQTNKDEYQLSYFPSGFIRLNYVFY